MGQNRLDSHRIPLTLHYLYWNFKDEEDTSLPFSVRKIVQHNQAVCGSSFVSRIWSKRSVSPLLSKFLQDVYVPLEGTSTAQAVIEALEVLPCIIQHDILRLIILYEEGGTYLDTDIELKQNLSPLLYRLQASSNLLLHVERVWREPHCEHLEKWSVTNATISCNRQNRMLKQFLCIVLGDALRYFLNRGRVTFNQEKVWALAGPQKWSGFIFQQFGYEPYLENETVANQTQLYRGNPVHQGSPHIEESIVLARPEVLGGVNIPYEHCIFGKHYATWSWVGENDHIY